MTDQAVAVQVFIFMFYWVPFALAAYLVEHWNEEGAQRWRRHLIHPIRHMREIRARDGAAAH